MYRGLLDKGVSLIFEGEAESLGTSVCAATRSVVLRIRRGFAASFVGCLREEIVGEAELVTDLLYTVVEE